MAWAELRSPVAWAELHNPAGLHNQAEQVRAGRADTGPPGRCHGVLQLAAGGTGEGWR